MNKVALYVSVVEVDDDVEDDEDDEEEEGFSAFIKQGAS